MLNQDAYMNHSTILKVYVTMAQEQLLAMQPQIEWSILLPKCQLIQELSAKNKNQIALGYHPANFWTGAFHSSQWQVATTITHFSLPLSHPLIPASAPATDRVNASRTVWLTYLLEDLLSAPQNTTTLVTFLRPQCSLLFLSQLPHVVRPS